MIRTHISRITCEACLAGGLSVALHAEDEELAGTQPTHLYAARLVNQPVRSSVAGPSKGEQAIERHVADYGHQSRGICHV